MIQENICHTYIHHKFTMRTNQQGKIFFCILRFKRTAGQFWPDVDLTVTNCATD